MPINTYSINGNCHTENIHEFHILLVIHKLSKLSSLSNAHVYDTSVTCKYFLVGDLYGEIANVYCHVDFTLYGI